MMGKRVKKFTNSKDSGEASEKLTKTEDSGEESEKAHQDWK